MSELVITNGQGKDVTTSLTVAKIFGKEHKHVLRDIQSLNCSYEFNVSNFGLIEFTDSRNRKQPAYEITKDGFSFLVMGYTGEKAGEFKEQFINEFNKRTALLQDDDFILQRAVGILNTRVLKAENQLKEAKNTIQALEPKRIFADAVSASKTTILVGELAKILKQNGIDIGQNRLFEWMREKGYLISRKGSDFNMPTQKAMNSELFEIKETVIAHSDGHTSINKTPKITGKGQNYFINKFLNKADTATKTELLLQ